MAFFVTSERPQILGGSCLLSVWRDQVPKKSGVHNLHDFATTRGRVDVDELKKKEKILLETTEDRTKNDFPFLFGTSGCSL